MTTPVTETTVLTEDHKDSVWSSTFADAQYRWNNGGWEVKTPIADWHPVDCARDGVPPTTVYAHSSEKFVQPEVNPL